MTILIIGSKGFIGSHALRYFQALGHLVYGGDVVHDYTSENYFLIDASNADFKQLFASHSFDWVLNCSGAASVPDSVKNPMRDFELNTHNVYKMLNALHSTNQKAKFINLSSAAVYGNPPSLPITETQALKPISPYGQHKMYSEQICTQFYTFHNMRTISLRVFSAYGEGLKKQFFWDLFQKTKQNNTIELWGTGNESRDYIYIRDLVQAVECVFLNARFEGQAINVANGSEVPIKLAAETFMQFFHQAIILNFNQQTRVGDPVNWCADNSLLKSLGYKPQFSLETGLKNYFTWLQNELD